MTSPYPSIPLPQANKYQVYDQDGTLVALIAEDFSGLGGQTWASVLSVGPQVPCQVMGEDAVGGAWVGGGLSELGFRAPLIGGGATTIYCGLCSCARRSSLPAPHLLHPGNEIGRQLLRTRRSFTATVLSADGRDPGVDSGGAGMGGCQRVMRRREREEECFR